MISRYGGFSFDIGRSAASINESEVLQIIRAALPNASSTEEVQELADGAEDILDIVNIDENMKVGGKLRCSLLI